MFNLTLTIFHSWADIISIITTQMIISVFVRAVLTISETILNSIFVVVLKNS